MCCLLLVSYKLPQGDAARPATHRWQKLAKVASSKAMYEQQATDTAEFPLVQDDKNILKWNL